MTTPLDTQEITSEGAASSVPDRKRRIGRVVIASLLGVMALMAWAFASPVGASPDDNFHLTSTWCAQGTAEGRCEPGEKPGEFAVPAAVAMSSACYATQPHHSGVCDTELTGMVETGHGNFKGLYPPTFYATMSVFVGDDVERSVLVMRAFNVLLAVALVTVLYVLLEVRLRAPLVWGLALTVVPMGMFLVASVNPSGWAILSAATLWIALWGYFSAPTIGRRIGLASIALVSAVLGAGSRGDSALYVAFGAVIACILSFERSKRWRLLALLPASILAIGFAFYLSSGQVDSALAGEMAGDPPESVDLLSGFLRTMIQIQGLWVGNFGLQDLGWGDTKMPAVVWVTTMTIFSGVCFYALSLKMRKQKAISLALAALALIAVPSLVIVQNNVIVGQIVQPRYVLPLMVIFAGICVVGFDRSDLSLSRVQLWIVLVGLTAANSVALYVNMRRYLTGTDYNGVNLDQNVEWWWAISVSPNVFWVLGSAAFGALLVLATGALRRKRITTST